jgi:polysaccharide pyruvyl transferase CsaB
MTRLLISGYYGFGNTGDEAILTVLLAGLRRRYADLEVTVVAGDPEWIAAEHGTGSVSWQDIAGLIAAAETADLMVLGGGGLFQDYWGCHPENILTPRHGNIDYWAGFALLARLLDKPLAIYAVGAGPLVGDTARRYTRLAFEHAGSATVRSEGSFRLLSEIGIDPDRMHVTADPAWLLDPAPPEAVEDLLAAESIPVDGKLRIAVSVRPWGDEAGWIDEAAAALDRLITEQDADIVFVPMHSSPHRHENDAHIATRIASRMQQLSRTTILRGAYTPAEILALIGSCDLTIGMRLHSMILSARVGVPPVALSYDPKVERVMIELGIGGSTLDMSNLTSAALADACSKALATTGPEREAIAGAVERLRDRATYNDDRLAAMIDHPIIPEPTRDLVAAVQRLAVDRARDQSPVPAAVELEELRSDRDRLRSAYEGLDAQHQAFVGARAVRAVQGYWELRERARYGVRSAAGRLPAPLRRSLRRRMPLAEPAEGFQHAIDTDELTRLRARISHQFDEVLELHRQAPGFVVYPPGIGWGVTLFQRPQQMALAFARLGYVVLYGLGWGNTEGVRGLREYEPRLYLTSVPDQLLDLYGRVANPMFISYVYNFEWGRHLDRPITVYEHIDDLEVFTHAYDFRRLTAWHQVAVAGADVAVASAVDLHTELLESRPDAVLVPNGVDFNHFAASRTNHTVPDDITDLVESGRPIIGYYGALAEWVDYDLIGHAARSLPDYQFLFIGPDYDGTVLVAGAFDLPNVRWLGPRDYRDLPAYLSFFDVATIPFVVNDVTHSVSPLKLFEYMAGGKPIVTPALRECARYRAVLTAQSPEDYVALLVEAVGMGNDPDYRSLLVRTARANTWGRRAGTLIDAAERARRTGRAPSDPVEMPTA